MRCCTRNWVTVMCKVFFLMKGYEGRPEKMMEERELGGWDLRREGLYCTTIEAILFEGVSAARTPVRTVIRRVVLIQPHLAGSEMAAVSVWWCLEELTYAGAMRRFMGDFR